jgi:hypothetical protein
LRPASISEKISNFHFGVWSFSDLFCLKERRVTRRWLTTNEWLRGAKTTLCVAREKSLIFTSGFGILSELFIPFVTPEMN